MPLRGVLFDLDDTLFDHDHATGCALVVLRREEPAFAVWSPDELARRHNAVLDVMHADVLAGRRSIDNAREARFRRLFEEAAGAPPPDGRAVALAARYREFYKDAWRPVPGALALLGALRAAGLHIAVVTNNLTAEQEEKMQRCEFEALVDELVTSENAGAAKPDTQIFAAALERLSLDATEVVMVGDAWHTDIEGAMAAGIRPVWFNRSARPAPGLKTRGSIGARGLQTPGPGVTELTTLEPTEDAVGVICAVPRV